MELDLWFFALAVPATIFAAVSKSGFGSGAAFAAASLMALVIPPGLALGIMLPLLMLVDAASLRSYWGKWSLREGLLVILGSLPGVALGAMLYKFANADMLRILIGVISLAFVAWQVLRARGWFQFDGAALGKPAGLIAGLTAGFTSFVSHAGGPPVAIYLLARGMDKTTYQATTILAFWMINIFKAVPYTFLGIFTLETLMIDLILAPFALFGTWLGIKAHHLVPEKVFFALTYALLVATGLKLIYDALV